MTDTCSRCKIKRTVGVTDSTALEITNFRTCSSCRNKLKEYRKTHLYKLNNKLSKKIHKKDDQSKVIMIPSNIEKYIKKGKTMKKYIDFNTILGNIYDNVKIKNLDIDEIVQIENFTVPKVLLGSTSLNFQNNKILNLEDKIRDENGKFEVDKDGKLFLAQDQVDNDDDGFDNGENVGKEDENENEILKSISDNSRYSVSTQAEQEERIKNELIESFEIHYISRIKHILSLSDLEFKFYVSSWKNGKYYVSFKCTEDKKSFKRFGIDAEKIDLIGENNNKNENNDKSGNNDNTDKTKNENNNENNPSVLKSKLLDWIEPNNNTNAPIVELNSKIENESVASVFHSSFGYYCQSKLNFIVDYSKLEFRIKFVHNYHNLDLKSIDGGNITNEEYQNNNNHIDKTINIENSSNDNSIKPANVVNVNKENLSQKLNKIHQTLDL